MITDSERFYSSILDLLEDPNEQEEVNALLMWWNRYGSYALQVVLNRLT
jgi:hypothetical protein